MLDDLTLAHIAVNSTQDPDGKYVVIRDRAAWTYDEEIDQTRGYVIMATRHKEDAIDLTNQIDRHSNVHMIHVTPRIHELNEQFMQRADVLEQLTLNDLEVVNENKFWAGLGVTERTELRTVAAMARIKK